MWLEERMKKWIAGVTGSEKAAFFSTLIAGLIGHLYLLTNIIPNFDGISRVYDEQQMTIAGRWFLHYASSLNWYTQMPMVIGVLSLLFLAFAQAWTMRLFEIKSVLIAAVWGAMSVLFPAVADTLTYTFTFSAYCISFLIAVAAVAVSAKYRWGFLPGAVLLAFSMGIYQTYVTVAITLSLMFVIAKLLREDSGVGETVLKGLSFILMIAGGADLYYAILRLFLYVKNLSIWTYLGMSAVAGGYPVEMLPGTLYRTYAEVFHFFFIGDKGLTNPCFPILNALILVSGILLLITVICQKKIYKNLIKMGGGFVLLLLFPVAINFTQILSPYSQPRLIMMYAFMYVYLLPLIFCDRVSWEACKKSAVRQSAAAAVLLVTIVHTVYFWEYDNLLYTMLDQAHRATLSFVTNVVDRVESCEGYTRGMDVVIVGGFPAGQYDTGLTVYDAVRHESAFSSSVIPLNKHIYYYMNDWINVPISEPAEEVFIRIADTQEFAQMPLYPGDGSVKVIDGCVVVKMSEHFTPRSEYEKEYEKRR